MAYFFFFFLSSYGLSPKGLCSNHLTAFSEFKKETPQHRPSRGACGVPAAPSSLPSTSAQTPSPSGLLIPGDAARGSILLWDTWRDFTCAPGEINPPRLSLSLTPQSTKTWCRFCAPNWRWKLWCAGKTAVLPPAVKWSGKCPSCQEGCKDEHGDGAWPAHVYMLRKYQLSLL